MLRGGLPGGTTRALRRLPAVVGGLVVVAAKELGWLTAHGVLYPAGLIADQALGEDPRHRPDTLPPLSRALILGDVAAHGTPIVLVHGVVDNRSAFAVLRRALRRRGFGRVATVNYSPLTADVRVAAARLGRQVERICAQTGYEKVHLVGHSLGGVIARYYVQRLGGDARVDTLVTIGSPHRGTVLARLFPLLVTRQLLPGSSLIADLAAPTRCRTPIVSIWSDRDEVVIPNRSAELRHDDLDVTNVRVSGVGHLSLLVDHRAVHAVITALSGRGASRPNWYAATPRPASASSPAEPGLPSR